MNTNRSLGLSHIRVTKEFLLNVLKENKQVHLQEYDDALRVYHETLILHYQDKIEDLECFTTENILDMDTAFDLIKPKSYADKYDLIIDMLECSVDEFVDISQDEYRQYVKDEWNWSQQFNMVKMAYSST